MTNSKSTKRALVSSAIATLVCIVMLIGTTFAWFTDTASTNVNKIQSGTLKVDIVDGRGTSLQGKSLSFVNKDGSADILWEPGATFKTAGFKIKNNGNLALKYKLLVNGIDGDSELLKVIKFSVLDEDGQAVDLDTYEGYLTAGNVSEKSLYIQGHMDEAAGNEYQGKELSGLSVTVVATQYTEESDSYGKDYDENAGYPTVPATAEELKTALTAGGSVLVTKDIETNNEDTEAARNIISKPTTLDLNAKIVSPDNMGNNNTNFVALIVDANTTINATANGGINTGVNGGYGLNVRKGATLTINNGYYYGGGTTVQVQKGTLIINGGTFVCEPFGDPYGYNFMINCIDSAYKNGTAKVIIKGGTFVNFDPSNCSAEGEGTNFVADGYKVTSEVKENGTYYTVVPK